MKKLVLSMVAFAVAFSVLSMALAAPTSTGPEVKLMSKGKMIKKVPLKEGLNVVKHPDGHQLKAWVMKGKVVRAQAFNPSGKLVGTQVAPKTSNGVKPLCTCFILIFCFNCN